MRHLTAILLYGGVLMAVLAVRADGGLRATDAWMRALPPGQATSAAYMTLHNGGERELTIEGVSTKLAQRVEIHESVQQDGTWRMRPRGALSLAPGESRRLAPGGMHLMLFGLERSPQTGETVQFELTLENGERLQVSAEVRSVAATGGHGHH